MSESDPEVAPDLFLSIDVDASHYYTARVHAISVQEASADFSTDQAPLLAVGQQVSLLFTGMRFPGTAMVRGWVCYRAEENGVRRYRFQLDRADGTALHSSINRRQSFRVTPDPYLPVRVTLRADGDEKRRSALLNDLSEGGLSVLINKEDEWEFARSDLFEVTLMLPGADAQLQFRGTVRYRRLVGSAVQYGLRFNENVEAAEPQREAVRGYVEVRRVAMLSKLAGDGQAA